MHLNHLETILPTRSVEKLSSTKPVPGAKKGWDCWCSILRYFTGEFAESTPEYLEFVVDVIHLCDTRLFSVKIGHSNLKIKCRHLCSLSPSLHYKSHPLFFFCVISSQPTSHERTVRFQATWLSKDGWRPENRFWTFDSCNYKYDANSTTPSNPAKGLNLGCSASVEILITSGCWVITDWHLGAKALDTLYRCILTVTLTSVILKMKTLRLRENKRAAYQRQTWKHAWERRPLTAHLVNQATYPNNRG